MPTVRHGEDRLQQETATTLFEKAVWPHATSVLRTARYLVRDPAEADDIAQETMIKAFRSISTFTEGTNPRAWLMSILRSVRADRVRAAGRTVPSVSLDQLGGDTEGAAVVSASDKEPAWDDPESLLDSFSDDEVIHALQALPEDIRWTLLLVEIEGIDHEEAARILAVPVGTVKSRAHRGRAMLRESLRPVAIERRMIKDMSETEGGRV